MAAKKRVVFKFDERSLVGPEEVREMPRGLLPASYLSEGHWESAKDRKDKIDMVLDQAKTLNDPEAVHAWRRLIRELGHLTHPEARMPRFNTLLHALWIAATNDHT